MNAIALQLLLFLIRTLITRERLEAIRALVLEYMTSDLPPEQRREAVRQRAKALGVDLSDTLLNLAIEAAVAWAKR